MLKRYIILAALVTASTAARAEQITLSVTGLVCAYCVQGIEKKFREVEAVTDIDFNLDTGTVTLTTKENGDVSDDTIKDIISFGGYGLTDIQRKAE
ncbi:MAG: heavy metal transporter [Alphaproteobacteria bacterium]|nr:heavy metal transporter [Alphaproteobacteria bacterium]